MSKPVFHMCWNRKGRHKEGENMTGSANLKTNQKKCIKCEEYRNRTVNFYVSYSKMHTDGRVPVCKTCLESMFDVNDMENSLNELLRQIDKPYIYHLLDSSIEENPSNVFGAYMKNVAMRQYRGMTWNDSLFKNETKIDGSAGHQTNKNTQPFLDFEITKEMIIRWGRSHNEEDYMKLEDFYHKMKDANRIETPQEESYLKKLAVISLKMDQELEAGNYQQVKQLGDLFSKYMADGKFRAMDRSDADKTGGIRTFSAIYAEVEKDGHIPPWEYYRKIKGLKQDIVDKTIMHIENFTLRLNKIDRMTEPPSDTPKLTNEDTDVFDGDDK